MLEVTKKVSLFTQKKFYILYPRFVLNLHQGLAKLSPTINFLCIMTQLLNVVSENNKIVKFLLTLHHRAI